MTQSELHAVAADHVFDGSSKLQGAAVVFEGAKNQMRAAPIGALRKGAYTASPRR